MPLCVYCTFEEQHSTHESQVKDFNEGLKENKQKMHTILF